MNDWSKMHDVPIFDEAGVSMPCQIGPSLLAENDKKTIMTTFVLSFLSGIIGFIVGYITALLLAFREWPW